ncbi:hypothetical protein PV325_013097 [Microctonus aethiopoides]|uniref:Signal peptidase complex subunit 2 n=1 Tax=Microctonus aethiopoides TaxID=144406 RepID=A0AA39KJJ9_9HYME|nr:hypothetical protein PV325_013097 [Microctonus aethiopoides]KAK0096502.1 hypothetical protein PV326_005303 [Microctonus aethiopoides]KAK0163707.1 hypothetical protein PV328_002411 [Microctonus aethiopoides]
MVEMKDQKEKKEQKDKGTVKINKWDGAAVKNALDDAVKEILTKKYNYIENYALLDMRLAICGVAVGISSIALLWDFLYPFPASRHVLVICVTIYFVLMALLNLYTTYKEKGIFVVAVQRDPAGFDPDLVWEASSYLQKYDDKYHLILSVKNETTGTINETSVIKSVANFVDVNGVVVPELLEIAVAGLHDSLTNLRKDK